MRSRLSDRRWLLLALALVIAPIAGLAVAVVAGSSQPPAAAAVNLPPHHGPGLTIVATSNPAIAGHRVTISGELSGVPGARGDTLVLWERLPGQRQFRAAVQTSIGRGGRYRIVRRGGAVMRNARWYVTAAGFRSATITERVEAVVDASATAALTGSGETVTLSVHVSPSNPRARVDVQMLSGTKWSTLAAARLNRRSRLLATYELASEQSTLRVTLPGNGHNTLSTSQVLDVNAASGIQKIQHVVIIMQENRSFDSYFGTYPGADGIPGLAGNPGPLPCLSDPMNGGCQMPFHDTADVNVGGPHQSDNAVADIDGGSMGGFIGQAETGMRCGGVNPNCVPCNSTNLAKCVDVMGYHDGQDIPNYWTYAQNFVLQDHMFAPTTGYSLPAHLYEVSGWSAKCTNAYAPESCVSSNDPAIPNGQPEYAWTDLTYLLYRHNVSWGYYIFNGTEPDCDDNAAMSCAPVQQGPTTQGIWNPLISFTDVAQDGQLGNIQSISNFYAAAKAGTLPAVSWVIPNLNVSEHPGEPVSAGQTYVTGLINAIMQSSDWGSTAIFLSWDDWGGFYDSVVPPAVDAGGYGIRVPGLVISPYAKKGYIDDQVLSHDAYNKFIEDDFLDGQRLNPATDGRPDSRPDVREALPILGDLSEDFDFNQTPLPPLTLPVCPQTDLTPPPKC